jgi:hypothetical protein
MKRTTLMVLLLAGVFAQGCSIYKASTAPPPVEVERVRVGTDRTELISVLGTPKLTEVTDGQRTDMFEFTSGFDQASSREYSSTLLAMFSPPGYPSWFSGHWSWQCSMEQKAEPSPRMGLTTRFR